MLTPVHICLSGYSPVNTLVCLATVMPLQTQVSHKGCRKKRSKVTEQSVIIATSCTELCGSLDGEIMETTRRFQLRDITRGFVSLLVPLTSLAFTAPEAGADASSYLNCVQSHGTNLDDNTALQLGQQVNRDAAAYRAAGSGQPAAMAGLNLMRQYSIEDQLVFLIVGCAQSFLPQ